MSGKSPRAERASRDPRARRTRRALLDALSALVVRRPYDAIRMVDVLSDAGVGRSTFYEHFGGKDDLVLESMAGILDALARAASSGEPPAALEHVLAHFWEVRALARAFLAGPVRPRLERELGRAIEARLAERAGASGLPARLAAPRAAAAQLALLEAWLGGRAACDRRRVAAGLCGLAPPGP